MEIQSDTLGSQPWRLEESIPNLSINWSISIDYHDVSELYLQSVYSPIAMLPNAIS